MSDKGKSLELKVTVTCSDQDPDTVLASMVTQGVRLTASPYTLKVTKLERADGQPFWLEAEFQRYWSETHYAGGEGTDWSTGEKQEAHDAYVHARQVTWNNSGK